MFQALTGITLAIACHKFNLFYVKKRDKKADPGIRMTKNTLINAYKVERNI